MQMLHLQYRNKAIFILIKRDTALLLFEQSFILVLLEEG